MERLMARIDPRVSTIRRSPAPNSADIVPNRIHFLVTTILHGHTHLLFSPTKVATPQLSTAFANRKQDVNMAKLRLHSRDYRVSISKHRQCLASPSGKTASPSVSSGLRRQEGSCPRCQRRCFVCSAAATHLGECHIVASSALVPFEHQLNLNEKPVEKLDDKAYLDGTIRFSHAPPILTAEKSPL
ncbi:uncharacterized protein ASPGLDRAFT_1038075 [Aspergillus glaucus CBS 516.65]|uniref:Uncharacterized protein n=1 Tax=Aspergillus glaucus CBS 516.65 TaxID=1160497 RepID=A0A1L9V6E4_ASPGL|nr:hypothetical protein ASPGLDRAFT_1038075 [Aspergillus glaucus CBS 516.65]OJJ79476.1 hypothetical protein ASPGLDRAFT_1038075 [Aspergillus glaucus CBS 516.65]